MSKLKSNNQFLAVINTRYNEQFFSDTSNKLGQELNNTGILILPNFISPAGLTELQKEAEFLKPKAYRSLCRYNLYVSTDDTSMPESSVRNKKFETTKGCIADDQIPSNSILRTVYTAEVFRSFICRLQNLKAVFPYADSLSSININYYDEGDNLEWHFDNADFAITLLIEQCKAGGEYEYFPDVRYNKNGKENYEFLEKILNSEEKPKQAVVKPGDLMIFRGNRSLHRVTKVVKEKRVLVTLNYNVTPGVALSEKSRQTFFGRT